MANIHGNAQYVYICPPVTLRRPFEGSRPPVYSLVNQCGDGDRTGLSVGQLRPMQLLIKLVYSFHSLLIGVYLVSVRQYVYMHSLIRLKP